MDWYNDNELNIPRGGVRTRFAPSPTGYMHIGVLRTALYAYLTAKRGVPDESQIRWGEKRHGEAGTFILRIEDTDTKRFVEGATENIMRTLRSVGLDYDEGPDIGGPAAPYTQSERKPLYRPYAELLCEKGAAYHCFCAHVEHDDRDHEDLGEVSALTDPCRDLPHAESKRRAENEEHVIRLKVPREGATTFTDMIFGDITVENKTLDDMVLLKSDGMPTYNFANIIDDHLMGITHIVRGNEFLASTPKYNLVYDAFGWNKPAYITVPPIMRDARHKFSKRRGDPTYEDLLAQGFLPDAVLNYIALLGWSPGGEREIFTLAELRDVFDVSGISKSPSLFDIAKLKHFNGEYIRAMEPGRFAELAYPYITRAVTRTDMPVMEIAALVQPRCETLADIPQMLGFIDAVPEYDVALYEHKKSKTDAKISLDTLRSALPVLEALPDWSRDALYGAQVSLAESLGVKNAVVMWPLRIAITGTAVTPGGAAEIAAILGRGETLARVKAAIAKLSASRENEER